jgi:hypothetical protein
MSESGHQQERIAIVIRTDGQAVAVYSDGVPFEALGRITAMPRASRVEWDATAQEWVARDAVTNAVVARGRSREAVLRQEHAHYVDLLARGLIDTRTK